MCARKSVDGRQRVCDPRKIWKWRGVDVEELGARGLAGETNVRKRDRVAMAIPTRRRCFEMRFQRGERGDVPMLAPLGPGRLVELEFVFQIFAHARHDQRMRIASHNLHQSPY